MTVPTQTALVHRARALLEAMTERARWVYALPIENSHQTAAAILVEAGFRLADSEADGKVERFETENQEAGFVIFENPELDVMLVEAHGESAAEALGKILEKTGYYAQSTLLRTAMTVKDPETSKALRTLAHMVVAWDEQWADLFLLHLASPDPIARHEAVIALSIATMVAREAGPARELLDEAERRESFPKLKETIAEARKVLDTLTGAPVEV